MPPPNKNQSGLGRAIINSRRKEFHKPRDSNLYTTDLDTRLQSVTQERDLDEFLNTAQLAGTEFTAEKQNVTVVQAPQAGATYNPFLLSPDEERAALARQAAMRGALRVPRRPPWKHGVSASDLERKERDSFLNWRRALAQVQDRDDLLLTPFERNIEVWRQLWRVLERSHLVVQIVDARNPLRFRCVDLETYVEEIASPEGGRGTRKSLLLINKADLLSRSQRKAWADYFDEQGITYAFYSAANANALNEAQYIESQHQHQPAPPPTSTLTEEDESQSEEDHENAQDSFSSPEADLSGTSENLKEHASPPPPSPPVSGSEDDEDDDGDESDSDVGHFDTLDENDILDESDPRIRVLSVQQLRQLFVEVAPDLSVFKDQAGKPPTRLTVGLVGYPNVGKSSTINSLLGEKKVSVSSTPGKTKHFQTILLSESMMLCDCPGLVFPQFATTKAELVCDGVLPIDQLREYTGPVSLVTRRIPREILEASYGLSLPRRPAEDGGTEAVTAEDLLQPYAVARGFARAGQGNPDEARASRYVLKDYVNARLLFCHPPPGMDAEEFNEPTRERAIARLTAESKKRAPVTRVGAGAVTAVDVGDGKKPQSSAARAVDRDFFQSSGLSARAFVKGSVRNGQEYARNKIYPHQNTVADDGTPINARKARLASVLVAAGAEGADTGKRHNKGNKRQKQRSGKGYD